jgi:pullulanase
MPVAADLLSRRATHLVLWRPNQSAVPPRLIIGRLRAGNPPTRIGERQFKMTAAGGVEGLSEVAAASCGLVDGDVFHYWFEVGDTDPHRQHRRPVRCTDPVAHTIDWRLTNDGGRQPAGVVRLAVGVLEVCDPAASRPISAEMSRLISCPRTATSACRSRLIRR